MVVVVGDQPRVGGFVKASHAGQGRGQAGAGGWVGANCGGFGGGEHRRAGNGAAGFGQREKPLDEIVHGFDLRVVEGEDIGQCAAHGCRGRFRLENRGLARAGG